MNKIYKVVWNKARNCYVVASEFAKNHSTSSVSKKKVSIAAILAAGMLSGFSPMVSGAANITDTTTPPKMIGYEQKWDTDTSKGKLSTSIKAYQYQGNSLQLNKLEFIKGKTSKGQNSLTIRLGAYVDGVNKEANIGFVDTNTTNAELSTTIDNKTGEIKSSLKDSDDKTVTSTVNISKYVEGKIADSVAVVYDKNKTSLKSTNSNGVGENAIALGKGASAVANSIAIGNGAYTQDGNREKGQSVALGNGAVTGAKSTSIGAKAVGGREGTITIGANANNGAVYATIVGTDSSINYESRNSGAVSTVIGSKNSIKNDKKTYSGVASSILGAANTIENSNGVTIQGTGNTVTGAYKDMNLNISDLLKLYRGDYSVLSEKENGAIAIIGGANTISSQTSSTVIGFGNTLKGENSTGVFTAGSHNKLTNVSNSLIMGDNNTLEGRKNVISLGNNNTVDADDAVAIGNGTTVTAKSGVAIGVGSVADRVAGKEKGVVGAFAPEKIDATNQSTWTSTAGAVSVGDTVNNITRQITNVAAGSEDTDAVNVSQLKGVETIANKGWNLTTGVVTDATQVKPGDTVDFSGDKNISVSHKGTDVSIALKDTLTLGSNATDDYVTVDGVKGTVWAGHAVSAGNVNMNGDSGEITGLTNTTLNSKDFATTGRAATEEQLKLVKNQADSAATEASKHSKVVNGSNITVEETAQDGQKTYKVGLNKNLEGIESISNSDAKINLNDTGVVISKGKDKTFSITDTGMGMSVIGDDYVTRSIMIGKTGTVISGGLSVAGSKITNVAAGEADTDAVNVGQLNAAVSKGNTDTHIDYFKDYTVGADNKVSMDVVNKNGDKIGNVTIKDVAKASDLGDVSKIADDIKNKKGNTTVVDAVNNVNKKVGDLNYSNVEKGDIKDGDSSTTAIGKLNQKLSDVEQTAGKHSSVSAGDSNINVDGSGKNDAGGIDYKVSLKKNLTLDSVTTGGTVMNTNGVKVGENVSLTKDGLTAGDTKVTNAGLSIGDKTYVSKDGLNANNQTITNVADGKVEKGSTDAVNGGQLYETNQAIANNATNISSLSHSISNLDNRVNKVGAGAAALAALHPLDFDPDAKWDFAAGYGNYRGTNAAAVGAYYRPNEDTMFSVGGTFGNGENMVNAGVSFKLGAGSSHVSTSRVAMAKEIKELRAHMAAQDKLIAQLTGPVNALTGSHIQADLNTLFPDVPKNHWAYDYVTKLAQAGYIEGYPDGNFKGDAMMTRYEFAAVIYRAMMNGAARDAKLGGDENLNKLLKEFEPELEYIRIDTIAKDKAGNPTIQRVRTVKANTNK